MSGARIVAAAWAGTALFLVTAAGAVFLPVLRGLAATVACGLFATGVVSFVAAYLAALRRSRAEAIGIGGLFFLAGDAAPRAVRRRLMGALAAQVAIALATASARPFTSAAFGILAPVYGVGIAGLWASRHGRFEPRSAARR